MKILEKEIEESLKGIDKLIDIWFDQMLKK